MTTVSDRRILCLWLPRLPTDRRARDRRRSSPFHARPEKGQAGEPPRATVVKVGSARLLAAVDRMAEAAGLEPGLGLAEARALAPELLVEPHDPEADAAFLEALATACDRYTPLVALTPPDGLLLDIAGCAHLFGGEAGLLRDLLDRLARAGLSARAAIAPTAGAAWAMAHYGRTEILAEADVAGALAPLPVDALRIAPDTIRTLKGLGLKTIADLRAQPRAPLAARFGPELLRRLNQALGQEDEPITPRRPLPLLVVDRRLAEPIFQWDVVSAYLERLAGALEERLDARGEGARRLVFALFHADGAVSEIAAATTGPVRDPGRITAVFAPKLEALAARQTIDSGIDLIRLAALETAPAIARQSDLDGRMQAETDLARLIDILSARLGAEAVTRLVAGDSHIPEFAAAALPAQRGEKFFAHASSLRSPLRGGELSLGARSRAGGEQRQEKWEGFSRSRQLASLAAARARPSMAGARSRADGEQSQEKWEPVFRPALRGESQSQSQSSRGSGAVAGSGLAEETCDVEPDPPERPLRLFSRPEPVEAVAGVPDGPPASFRWRKVRYQVARAEGPERIAAEWWHGGAVGPTRDYFRVEDTDGRRFWLFREGLYERETAAPRWYLHGLFA